MKSQSHRAGRRSTSSRTRSYSACTQPLSRATFNASNSGSSARPRSRRDRRPALQARQRRETHRTALRTGSLSGRRDHALRDHRDRAVPDAGGAMVILLSRCDAASKASRTRRRQRSHARCDRIPLDVPEERVDVLRSGSAGVHLVRLLVHVRHESGAQAWSAIQQLSVRSVCWLKPRITQPGPHRPAPMLGLYLAAELFGK